MFANYEGGILIIGVHEIRDAGGQPTGVPDPNAEIGIELRNPEKQLLAYENRVIDCIDERLPVEMHSVGLASGHYVLVIRVPNSLSKPHRVSYKGRTSFPCRRERRRYELDAREIKDLAMRAASQLDRAEFVINAAIDDDQKSLNPNAPVLSVALLPVFFRNFVVNLKSQSVSDALRIYAHQMVCRVVHSTLSRV
jgi:predicted HTH transcriptional regulator